MTAAAIVLVGALGVLVLLAVERLTAVGVVITCRHRPAAATTACVCGSLNRWHAPHCSMPPRVERLLATRGGSFNPGTPLTPPFSPPPSLTSHGNATNRSTT